MFILLTDKKGEYSIRPILIGSIKNHFIRRLLLCLVSPVTLLVAIFVNLLVALTKTLLVFVVSLFSAVFSPIVSMKMIYKTEIWRRPRTKYDKKNKMN
jgi:hypothetical protein